jgi:hypothetical protein
MHHQQLKSMDREVHVTKGDDVLAELSYDYLTGTGGIVFVKANRIIDLGGGITTVVPLFQGPMEFSHDVLGTIGEVKKFDLQFCNGIPELSEQLNDDVQFAYPPVRYRYMISVKETIGVADIYADLNADKKQMGFVSTVRINEDAQFMSNSLEINIDLLNRFCQLQHFGDVIFDKVDHTVTNPKAA